MSNTLIVRTSGDTEFKLESAGDGIVRISQRYANHGQFIEHASVQEDSVRAIPGRPLTATRDDGSALTASQVVSVAKPEWTV